jgi:hypothetical protein
VDCMHRELGSHHQLIALPPPGTAGG